MAIDTQQLLTRNARSGAPLFYPDPAVPVTFSFDQGVAAEATFPLDELEALHREVLDRDGPRALEYISFELDERTGKLIYSPTFVELVYGHTGLREQVAAWTGARQDRDDLEADGVILTSGAVQAIALAVGALVDPGEGAIVEAATFPYTLRFLATRDAVVRAVSLDGDGLDVDALERRLGELRDEGIRPKLLYTIPSFQMPTGASTTLERRRRILELAEEWDLVVLEDHVFGDLRYSGVELPSLLALDTTGRVIQCNGFGKTVAPGLRLGWMTGSAELIAGLAAVREDLGVSQWTARAMELYVERGLLDAQLARVAGVYRSRRDAAVDALREHCSPWVEFDVPDGGFFLWLRLSEDVDWSRVADLAAAGGVAIRPGERLMDRDGNETGPPYMRLAFSHVDEDEIARGIACVGSALAEVAGSES